MSSTSSRTSTGSTGVTTIQMKPSSNGKGASADVLKVTEQELSVEDALEAAKKEAGKQQAYILKLENEKKERDRQENERKLKIQSEAEERKQFEAFKSFMLKVVDVPKIAEPVEVEQPKTSEPVPQIQEQKLLSGGLFGNRLLNTIGGTTVALVLLYFILLGFFGKANDSVRVMFNSFPLRMFISLLMTVVAVGIGFIGLWLVFPEQFKYLHSKFKSVCSPNKDWEAGSPEFRLQYASEQLWRFAFLFVLSLMVIFS